LAEPRAKSTGLLIAQILTQSWRDSPPALEISAEDLTRVAPLLLGSGGAALAWWRIRHSELRSSPEALQLQHAYHHFTLESDLHERDIKHVFTLFRAAGVEPLLVKGWASARPYPEPGMRVYGDMDLYVRPDQHEAALRVVKSPECSRYLVDLVYNELSRLDNRSFDELYARSQPLKLDQVVVRIPAPEDHLRIQCLHLLKHGAWRPLWLCDVAAAVENLPADFNWELCLGGDKRQADWVACTIGLAHQLLGADVHETPVAERASRLPRWLVPAVLKQWEKPCAADHHPSELMANTLRNRKGLLEAFRNRWPDPIQATIWMRGPFNELPRFPFQLSNYISQAALFLAALPRALANQQR
jgi:Uncharacterised nucleotidyltransferase